MTTMPQILKLAFVSCLLVLTACGGGGSSTPTGGGGGGGGGTAEPADRWVVSGNNDGTLSILRVNPVADYATAVAYARLPGLGFSVVDMFYDSANQRLLALDSQGLFVIGVDENTGDLTVLDSAATSTSGNSHLVLSADGSEVYVATGSGTTGFIDAFTIDAAGTLSALTPMATSVDPYYIQTNPAGDRLYVHYTDENIEVFSFDASAGALNSTGNQLEDAGDSGGFTGTPELVAPLLQSRESKSKLGGAGLTCIIFIARLSIA